MFRGYFSLLRESQRGFSIVSPPRPRIAEPKSRQEMERSRVRPAIYGGDFDQKIIDVRFGVFDKNIEIPILVEYAGVQKFKFGILPAAQAVFFDQSVVRKLGLR